MIIKTKHLTSVLCLLFSQLFFSNQAFSQYTIYEPLDLDRVEFSIGDFGRMWTFDAVPVEDFKKRYNFRPDAAWLEYVRLSALQLSTGCSASFVSKEGLIMTNHHCVRGILGQIQKPGENIFRDGFYASKPEDERRFPDVFADQLIEIEDVTEKIYAAMDKAEAEDQKIALRDQAIAELENQAAKESGLQCQVVTLYNGGKFSLYKYKRYNDVRAVLIPDVQIAATGWDWDNFTYPRYELDFAFLRAYDENGEPVKSPYFFNWSEKGASEDEPIFVIGRPGNTDRLLTVKQLEYFRDHQYPGILTRLNEFYHAYFKNYKDHPEREAELLGQLLSVANARKVYAGMLLSLNDEYLMAKKRDFEENLREKVSNDSKLRSEYGDLWDEIDDALETLEKTENAAQVNFMMGFGRSEYFERAMGILEYARQMQLPADQRDEAFKGSSLAATKEKLSAEIENQEFHSNLIIAHANFLHKFGGPDHPLTKAVYNGKKGKKALEYVKENSKMWTSKQVAELLSQNPEKILNSDDPFIRFLQMSNQAFPEFIRERQQAQTILQIQNQRLGKLIFDAYGDQIPPDATSTLRINDGMIKEYEYNGTIAPGKTTYYGLWDRYHSFGKEPYPWGLHPRWQKPPKKLDLSIPIGFASTNDIVGGNSGSAMINKKAEIVGLVHDGNLESIGGSFAFLPENNRAVATDSWGLMEALKYVYKAKKLVKELENGER